MINFTGTCVIVKELYVNAEINGPFCERDVAVVTFVRCCANYGRKISTNTFICY